MDEVHLTGELGMDDVYVIICIVCPPAMVLLFVSDLQ